MVNVIRMGVPPEGSVCEVHDLPTSGLARRLMEQMQQGGVNVCPDCILRARDNLRELVQARARVTCKTSQEH